MTNDTLHARFLTRDLLFSSRIQAVARPLGWTVTLVRDVARLADGASPPRLVIVDLSAVDSQTQLVEILSQAAGLNCPVLAFGPHVHQQRLEMAQQQGCDWVMTRGQFHRDVAAILQQLARSSGGDLAEK